MTKIPKSAVTFLHYWVAGFHVVGYMNRPGTKFWVEMKHQVNNNWKTYNVFPIDRERAVRLVDAANRHEKARDERLQREEDAIDAAYQAEMDELNGVQTKSDYELAVEAGQKDLFAS